MHAAKWMFGDSLFLFLSLSLPLSPSLSPLSFNGQFTSSASIASSRTVAYYTFGKRRQFSAIYVNSLEEDEEGDERRSWRWLLLVTGDAREGEQRRRERTRER